MRGTWAVVVVERVLVFLMSLFGKVGIDRKRRVENGEFS